MDTDDVANVEQLHVRERVAEHVFLEVELHAATLVGEMRERGLSVTAPGDDAPGDAHRRPFLDTLCQGGRGLTGGVRPLEPIRKGRYSPRDQLIEFLAPGLLDEVEVLLLVAHAAAPLLPCPAPPLCFKYASMNSSMSPSMIRCTSGIFSSVR